MFPYDLQSTGAGMLQKPHKKSMGMELIHPLTLQEAAERGETFTPRARAVQVRACAHLASLGQEVGSPPALGAGCAQLGGAANPMARSLLFFWIPVGLALMVWSPDRFPGRSPVQGKSCCWQKPAASLGLWAAAWPRHPAERAVRSTERSSAAARAGGGGGFSSPTHISTVVIHRSVTGTSVQRERSNTGPAEQRNCFQGCCLLARGCVVIVTADWGFLIYFLPFPCPFPCSKLTSVALKVGRASIFESYSCCSPSLGRVGHLGSLVRR